MSQSGRILQDSLFQTIHVNLFSISGLVLQHLDKALVWHLMIDH